jgi:hypothetical protein
MGGGGSVGGLFEVQSWYLPKLTNGREETLVRTTAGYLGQYLNSGPSGYEMRALPIRPQRFRGIGKTGSVRVTSHCDTFA